MSIIRIFMRLNRRPLARGRQLRGMMGASTRMRNDNTLRCAFGWYLTRYLTACRLAAHAEYVVLPQSTANAPFCHLLDGKYRPAAPWPVPLAEAGGGG